jgi:dipeptidyl-peptidase 4
VVGTAAVPAREKFLIKWPASGEGHFGVPRGFAISPDGARIMFQRSRGPSDPVQALWLIDHAQPHERLVADPRELVPGYSEHDLTPVERFGRERARHSGSGVLRYSVHWASQQAVFALAGGLFLVDFAAGCAPQRIAAHITCAFDPELSPAGTHVAVLDEEDLVVIALDSDEVVIRLTDARAGVAWGVPDYVAAEAMRRHRGYWWSPDGSRLLVARSDQTGVGQRWVAAGSGTAEPDLLRYPVVGSPNAITTLWQAGLDGQIRKLDWPTDGIEYVARVEWSSLGLIVTGQTRDQRTLSIYELSGATATLRKRQRDAHWIDLQDGLPTLWAPRGELITIEVVDDRYTLAVDGQPVTPAELQVHRVLAVTPEQILFQASTVPTVRELWTYTRDGRAKSVTAAQGVCTGTMAAGTTVVIRETLGSPRVRTKVHWADGQRAEIASLSASLPWQVRVRFLQLTGRAIWSALVLPSWHRFGGPALPLLLDPYGGAAAQRVLRCRREYQVCQWFAEQGYAVLVVDGRGTPGRGARWAREVHGDLITAPLADQADAVADLDVRYPGLVDTSRVGIRGWSYGGLLAASAVLRRPDVFRVAVAGAAPLDQFSVNSHWKERYLGDPHTDRRSYERSSLLNEAERLRGGLLLIHGTADDNVTVMNSVEMSQRLAQAGRAHSLLLLPETTHFVRDPAQLRYRLTSELAFLNWYLAPEQPQALATPGH